MSAVVRIKPNHYCHILDTNANVSRVEVGPQTFTRKEHEQIVLGPVKMVMIPNRSYCRVLNPVVVDDKGVVQLDQSGNAALRFGFEEVRLARAPFPLYPGEILSGAVTQLSVIAPQCALKVRALRAFDAHVAGEVYLVLGPATYYPRVEEEVVELVKSEVVKEGEALKLRAVRDFAGRKAGEEWLVRQTGAYLLGIHEQIVDRVRAVVLTETKALHLLAKTTFRDVYGIERKAGSEWLVTLAGQGAEAHIPDVFEAVVGERTITSLNNRQYCVVLNPVDANGSPQHGKRELRKGEVSFFLQPSESLLNGRIEDVHVLSEEEALLLQAIDSTDDRKPGERWLIRGPCEYIPPVTVQVVEHRKLIPLDEGEGVYVRSLTTGAVRAEVGRSYLVKEDEVLWEKNLDADIEAALTHGAARVKTSVVTYHAPYGTAVQVYDFKKNEARVVFGPDLVVLQPYEQFTLLTLSGGQPKHEGVVKALHLELGPSFMTDIVEVETSDHAKLRLKLAYNWKFEVTRESKDAHKIFQISDFVGICCRGIASRIRGVVATQSFETFHQNSTDIIKQGVFGARDILSFPENLLVVTGVDVQSVEPVDQRTVDALAKSVQQAIEITTKAQEDAHRREAKRLDQINVGLLERQKISAQIEQEEKRKELVVLRNKTETAKKIGQAKSQAQATRESAKIAGEAAVSQAELKAQAVRLQKEQELAELLATQANEREHVKASKKLQVDLARERAAIEAKKFAQIVAAIGAETIKEMARAGPEMQAKLLEGLGLQGVLITDGNSPINLFSTATSMVATGAARPAKKQPVQTAVAVQDAAQIDNEY